MRGETDITRRALVAALAFHVALACALLVTPPRPRPFAAPSPPSPLDEVTIDLVSPYAAPSPTVAVRPALALAPAPVPTLALAPAPAPTLAPPLSRSPATAFALATSLPAAPPRIGLALDGPNTFATATAASSPASAPEARIGPPSPTTPSGRAATVLRDPARQRERELGLGPEGPVLRALGDATTASFAPVKGRAVFRAIADGTGMIVGIEVVDCDGGRAGWANAAELAVEALKGKKLRMPSTATRASMRIEVVSEMKMPSGHDPGVDVSILGVPITKGEGNQATKVRILDPLSLNAFALGGDPVDIGAKARRVVRSRLLDSEVL